MTANRFRRSTRTAAPAFMRRTAASAFTLIELLTVIFIIGILIAILIPSLNAARRQAKSASTAGTVRAIGTSLELFKNENERDFTRTNGYPPSFSHPVLLDDQNNPVFTEQDSAEGRFPFFQSKPHVYGAHLLPVMLMGLDFNGYIRPSSVPKDKKAKPWEWYEPDVNGHLLQRSTLYMDPGKLRLLETEELGGSQPAAMSTLFPDWDDMKDLPVILDNFDTPVLYYASNRAASPRNLVEDMHKPDHNYSDEGGPPFYFHQDNRGFTGFGANPDGSGATPGWNFAGEQNGGMHAITAMGHLLKAEEIDEYKKTFANYIHDETAHDANQQERANWPMRARNGDSYILLSPGADGLYGTVDDVSNLPGS